MAKLIPQSFITDLLAKVDIVDIIGARVKLRKTGSNLTGLCPFHNEKSPSFTVSPAKQFFHCFGCHAHGNAIGFMMQFEHLNFVETVENLAAYAGLAVPNTSEFTDKSSNYKDLYKINEQVANFLEQQLPHSLQAVDYLKSRGFTGAICKRFRIGYASADWENLRPIYNRSNLIKQQMVSAGLLIIKNGKAYSRFRDRITFPIYDVRGRIIGFGGRTIGSDPAKYLNSPETPIFHKGEELYGLYEAKKNTKNLKFMIVVEGYLDVIALAQFGISNVAATLGTAISTKQIQLLLRTTPELIFCFDGDQAGRTAAWRALENCLPIMRDGIQIKFLFLPETDDPDSLIRKESAELFNQRLEQALPLSDFFIRQLSTNININSIDGKAKLAKTGKELLKKMPYSIFHQLLSNKIAELANINIEELKAWNDIHPSPVIHPPQHPDKLYVPITYPIPPVPVQNIINILLHNPHLITHVDIENLKSIKLTGTKILVELTTLLKEEPNISMGAILETWRDRQEVELLEKLACREPIIPKENLKNELTSIIQSLGNLERDQSIQDLLTKASNEALTVEEKQKLQNLIEISKK